MLLGVECVVVDGKFLEGKGTNRSWKVGDGVVVEVEGAEEGEASYRIREGGEVVVVQAEGAELPPQPVYQGGQPRDAVVAECDAGEAGVAPSLEQLLGNLVNLLWLSVMLCSDA